ncbi:MAG: divergent polysaccharide deacetylase family protein [Candidatus Omnitrophica bacterium]|nr:divergent polysaccharide deacetylase family protein [Candidatus Omnitrophota bacterium]
MTPKTKRKSNNNILKFIIGILLAFILLQWVFVTVSKPRKAAPPVVCPPEIKIKGKIAIVIDDWGYNLNNLPIVEGIRYPFTAAILPNLGSSAKVAKELNARGFEVILHLPMQPHGKNNLEKNTIRLVLNEHEIKDIMDMDLANIVYAKGVSNHMGSEATEDARVMGIVFKELKNRNLYFLDSFVSNKSVCEKLAKKTGLPFAKRDIFLDNDQDPAYIKAQINKLKRKARMKGEAIGIGHDRRNTLLVLKEVMPQIENEGYKFVLVSDLVKSER